MLVGRRVSKWFEGDQKTFTGEILEVVVDGDSQEFRQAAKDGNPYVTVRWDDGIEEEYQVSELTLL